MYRFSNVKANTVVQYNANVKTWCRKQRIPESHVNCKKHLLRKRGRGAGMAPLTPIPPGHDINGNMIKPSTHGIIQRFHNRASTGEFVTRTMPWCLQYNWDSEKGKEDNRWKKWNEYYDTLKKASNREGAGTAIKAAFKAFNAGCQTGACNFLTGFNRIDAANKVSVYSSKGGGKLRFDSITFRLQFTFSFLHDPYLGPRRTDTVYSVFEFYGRACIPLKYLGAFYIPPPLEARLCVHITIGITFKPTCPDQPGPSMYGKGELGFTIDADFIFVYINGADVRLGLESGFEWIELPVGRQTVWCWWKPADENANGGRRRYWDRRRRAERKCSVQVQTEMVCTHYTRGYLTITLLGIVRFTLEWKKYSKRNRVEHSFRIEYYRFWDWIAPNWSTWSDSIFWVYYW